MARPLARAVLSFGLVAIPVEIHTATKDQTIHFNYLHAKCGSRVRNRRICPVCNVTLEPEDLVRGYEIEKGKYVQVTDEELESLEAETNNSIELREFIPISKVDPVFFEHSYYLAPAVGGEKPYRLLADTMAQVGRAALAEMVSNEKEKLVLIRSAQGGLILQVMFYANEVRDFGAIPKADGQKLTPQEFELATGLMEKLSSPDFDAEIYHDEHHERVTTMLDAKVKGQEITVAPKVPSRGQVVDIYEAAEKKSCVGQAEGERG